MCFSSQNLYSLFTIPSQVVLVEWTITIPNLLKKVYRGQISLFELLVFKPAHVCLQVPVLTLNPGLYAA